MSSFAWMILGLVAGYIASKIVNSRGEGIIRDILLGIVGALTGGRCSTCLEPLAQAASTSTVFS